MPGFRGNGYAGVAGADLENAPQGPVPFTSPFGLPVSRMVTWHAGGVQPGGRSDGVPGTPVGHASGNPDVATRSKWGPVQEPYGGSQGGGISQFGQPRQLNQAQETSVRSAGNAPVGSANDKLISYDRHGMLKSGYENSGRKSGYTDPPMDGPARPSLWLVQRTINYQQGTNTTAATDDLSRDFSRVAMAPATSKAGFLGGIAGRILGYTGHEGALYAAEQGTGWAPVYGGVPGLWQPYGSYAGITNGPVSGIQSPVAEGQPGDGPQKIWSGPPHGLHSPTLPDYAQTIGRYMAIPQMAAPRQDRPSNSPIAGQSYSQTVQPQGQVGTAAQNTKIGSGVNFNQRLSGNGWRGRGAGG
jgi:hypothetical protein